MSKLLYQGSVKNVYEADQEHLEFEFTDAYSVFDWGRMPDLIEGKGNALTSITESIYTKLQNPNEWKDIENELVFKKTINHYSRLEKNFENEITEILNKIKKHGLKTHFIKKSSSNRILVRKVKVYKPTESIQNGNSVYTYPNINSDHFIPLEIVFRLGVTKGSSFNNRANSNYLKELGFIKDKIDENEFFGFPVIEMFSKLEPQDRFVQTLEAKKISSLEEVDFKKLQYTNLLVVIFLNKLISKSGLILIDGKTEWAIDENHNLILVDSIGPDELRILDESKEIQLSKEFLRNYYRNTDWYKSLQKEKLIGGDWKKRLINSNQMPQKLSNEYLSISKRLFKVLADLFSTTQHEENLKNQNKLQLLLKDMRACLS